jgi:hypothetical protein
VTKLRTRPVLALLAAASLAGGCTWVPLDPGAEAVTVRDADDAARSCERLGKTHTRTSDGLGPIPRRPSAIEEELVALARNEAVRMGGNAVAPLSTVEDGEQSWAIYRCP